MDMKKPGDGIGRVVVIGGGSVGSLFSGRIAAIKAMKERVWLLTQWQEHFTAMSEMKGIVVREEGTAGAETMMGAVRPASSAKIIIESRADFARTDPGRFQTVVFLAVKQGQIRQAAEQAAQILHELGGGLCVTLLNGMGHIEVVKNTFKYHDVRAAVVHGLFYGGAHMPGPGMVVHSGAGVLELGFTSHTDDITHALLNDLCELLRLARLPTRLNPNITAAAWEKLIVNASINALTALLHVRNGALPSLPPASLLMHQLCYEAHAVAVAALHAAAPAPGITPNEVSEDVPAMPRPPPSHPLSTSLLDAGPGACLERVLAVAEQTAHNKSSMLQDVLGGKRTEVEAINGFVVAQGERLGVPTPVNRTLLLLLQALHQLSPDRKSVV